MSQVRARPRLRSEQRFKGYARTDRTSAGVRWATVRKLALSFPGMTEGSSYGEHAFLLDGKFFSRFNEKERGLVVYAVHRRVRGEEGEALSGGPARTRAGARPTASTISIETRASSSALAPAETESATGARLTLRVPYFPEASDAPRRGKNVRLLIFPALLFGITALITWTLGDRLVLPESFDEVVVWLRSHGAYAWAVGGGVILADALLPVPSTPAMFSMGIIYGPLLGGLVCGIASVMAGLMGFGATRMLGRRGALYLVGEKDLQRTEAFYERWGLYAVVFGRAVGGPAEWAVILAGLSRMPFLHVLGALVVGGFVSGLVMATLGAVAVMQPLLAVAITSVLLGAMLLAARWVTKSA